MKAVILCGGEGKRLWPLSRHEKPKQIVKLMHGRSGIQNMALKLKGHCDIVLVSVARYASEIAEQMREISVDYDAIIVEPEGRNTAGAICAASIYIKDRYGEETKMIVMPSDHEWGNDNCVSDILAISQRASGDFLRAVGIKAKSPETKYGYIKKGVCKESNLYDLASFVEKPTFDVAKKYVNSGRYLWNTGIYTGKASVFIEEIKKYGGDMYDICAESVCNATSQGKVVMLGECFSAIEKESIDRVVSEKSDGMEVYEIDNKRWGDIGTFDSLIASSEEVSDTERVMSYESRDIYGYSEDEDMILVGLKEVVVMNLHDQVVILHKHEVDKMRSIVKQD